MSKAARNYVDRVDTGLSTIQPWISARVRKLMENAFEAGRRYEKKRRIESILVQEKDE